MAKLSLRPLVLSLGMMKLSLETVKLSCALPSGFLAESEPIIPGSSGQWLMGNIGTPYFGVDTIGIQSGLSNHQTTDLINNPFTNPPLFPVS
jgi:hypothetical protein